MQAFLFRIFSADQWWVTLKTIEESVDKLAVLP